MTELGTELSGTDYIALKSNVYGLAVFRELVCVLILDYSSMCVVLVQILATWSEAVYNHLTTGID